MLPLAEDSIIGNDDNYPCHYYLAIFFWQYAGLSLLWPLPLWSTGSGRAGPAAMAHRPSCSAACGIFPDRGTNPCPLHWQADSQPLCHQGSPCFMYFESLLLSGAHLNCPADEVTLFIKCVSYKHHHIFLFHRWHGIFTFTILLLLVYLHL